MIQKNPDKKDFSRRRFLKSGVALSAAVGLSTVAGGKASKEVVQAIGKKELDEFPIELSPDFKRYDESRTIILQTLKTKLPNLTKEQFLSMGPIPEDMMSASYQDMVDTGVGYSQVDKAFKKAGWVIADNFGKMATDPMYSYDGPVAEKKYKFESKEEASKTIKRAAKKLGADLVGIAPYDERWTYEHIFQPWGDEKCNFPFTPKSVIVMCVEMDYEGLKTAPTYISEGSVGLGYSNMAITSYRVATFLRQLGYNAFACGNSSSESVPNAIAAGLGEMGRMGLIITQEYGPRVRLCKVYTEMELAYDKPIEFGAMKFCEYCKRCAEACPSDSIPFDDKRSFNTLTDCNHAGMKKWYVNVETCYEFWRQTDTGCGVCITVCPYNKPDFWHHRITSALTSTPLKPFLKSMDEIFGYGPSFSEEACYNFWEK